MTDETNIETLGWTVDPIKDTDNGERTVKEVSVTITKSLKLNGDIISVSVGETATINDGQELDGILTRAQIAQVLSEQADVIIKTESERMAATHKSFIPTPVVSPTPAGSQAYAAPVAGTGLQAVQAAANGAPVNADGGWRSVPSRFGDGDIRFLPCSVFPTVRLEQEVQAFLSSKGLNPGFFKVWDNRPGPRGLEAGAPNGAVAAVKLNDGAPGKEQMGNNAAARVKFNNDGSLYIWLTKEFEAALKFIGPALSQAGY